MSIVSFVIYATSSADPTIDIGTASPFTVCATSWPIVKTTGGSIGIGMGRHCRSASVASFSASRAAVAAATAAAQEAGRPGAAEDGGVGAAVWAYRNRRALYNGPSELLQRWGVELHPRVEGVHASDVAVDPAEPQEHRSGVGGVPFFNLLDFIEPQRLAVDVVQMLREEWLPDYKVGSAAHE